MPIYLVDAVGNFLVDDLGNFLIVGYDGPSAPVTVAQVIRGKARGKTKMIGY